MIDRDPNIYIDCTSTFLSGLNTGVQRVVRALVKEVSTFTDVTKLNCIPISYQFNGFYRLEDAENITLETISDFKPVDFYYKDIYFCPDAFWSYGMTSWYDYFRDQGVSIATIIYDLIPIVNSEFFNTQAIEEFESSLLDVIRKSDLLLTISESTRQDLIAYCFSKGEYLDNENCKVIPLAPALEPSKEDVDCTRLPSDPFFLMVGTVEPRRGYIESISEYQTYLAEGGKSSLLIIGKEGSASEAVSKCILEASGKVLWLTDANDAEVMAAYRHAQAVICSSRSEGYGMSVSEGLVYNGLVLANRLPVFGEFAGSRPYYFDIDRCGDLARLLAATPDLARSTQVPNMGSWQNTAKVLASELVKISNVHGHHQAIELKSNSEEAVRWAYWMLFNRACTPEEIKEWLKFDTVQAMFEALQYESRTLESPLSRDSIRWLQLSMSERQEISDEEISGWLERCVSIKDMRRALMVEQCRLDAPVSELFVRVALLSLMGRTSPAPDELEFWLNFESTQTLLEALHYESRNPLSSLRQDSVRWLQLAINERQSVGSEEVAYWFERCDSLADLRRVLMTEHCRLDAPISEFFVRWALVAFMEKENPTQHELALWLKNSDTNRDFLAKLRREDSTNG